MDEDYDGPEGETLAPAKMNHHDYLSAAYILLRGVARAWTDAFETLALVHVSASAAVNEKQQFEREAGRALEALPVTDPPRG